MSSRIFERTERRNEVRNPLDNLALTLAVAFLRLADRRHGAIPAGIRWLL